MTKSVAAVELNEQDFQPDDRLAAPAGHAGGTARFVYPSGSRPLEGYTIRRGLGHGGFGEVYYATSDGGKEVALKLLRRNLDIELRGIRHCLNLKHPNLLTIYDIREDSRADKWVVMEFITGQSLEDVLAIHPQGLPEEQVLAWIHGIAAGVGYLHDHGIVHRDLKPGNIFCDEGLVKIGDYGLSKFISCSRRSGQTESVGTVHYMAPEVANGRYGKEIDVYALGIVLFEMLTGKVPFEGESIGEVLMKHLTATPDVSMLPEPYRTVVAKALEKDPTKRYPTVGEMLDQLPQPAHPYVHAAKGTATGGCGPQRPYAATAAFVGPEGDEPILRAVRQFCIRSIDAWNRWNLNTPTKIVILAIGMVVALAVVGSAWPLTIVILASYGGYWIARSLVLSGRHPQALVQPVLPIPAVQPARVQPVAATITRPHRWRRKENPADALILKPVRERVTELFGSLLGSGVVAVIICLVMVILNSFRDMPPQPEQFAWLSVVSALGAWSILIAAKFWEGVQGDSMLRRFILMVIGMGVGLISYGVATALMVDLPYDPKFTSGAHVELPPSFYNDGTPLLLAHVACFGTLFLAVRWWRQADPLRATRMSLWAMVFSVAVAWLTAAVWLYPQPWLPMAACTTSVAVQLASPFVDSRRRFARSGETAENVVA